MIRLLGFIRVSCEFYASLVGVLSWREDLEQVDGNTVASRLREGLVLRALQSLMPTLPHAGVVKDVAIPAIFIDATSVVGDDDEGVALPRPRVGSNFSSVILPVRMLSPA